MQLLTTSAFEYVKLNLTFILPLFILVIFELLDLKSIWIDICLL